METSRDNLRGNWISHFRGNISHKIIESHLNHVVHIGDLWTIMAAPRVTGLLKPLNLKRAGFQTRFPRQQNNLCSASKEKVV